MLLSKLVMSREEFILLREYIQKECGIQVGDDQASLIENRLTRLVTETGNENFKDFYHQARKDASHKLRNKIIDAMTTSETLWFRDSKSWDIVREVIIPGFIDDLKSGRKRRLQVWSAACSSGQEPYTFAMLLHEALVMENKVLPTQVQILGTDISPSALFMAISARYNPTAMSNGMQPGYQERFFEQNGCVHQLIDNIRNMVAFKQFNLLRPFENIPECDLILCRNVAMFFSSEVKRKLFRKLYDKLDENGYLLLGANECVQGYSDDFEQLTYKNSAYYKPRK